MRMMLSTVELCNIKLQERRVYMLKIFFIISQVSQQFLQLLRKRKLFCVQIPVKKIKRDAI